MTAATEPPRSSTMTLQEFLARQRRDVESIAQLQRIDRWRVTSDPIPEKEFWALFDNVVLDDGTVDLTPALPAGSGSAGESEQSSAMVAELAVAVAILGVCVAAASLGYQAGKDLGTALDDAPAGTTGGGTPGGGTGGGGDGAGGGAQGGGGGGGHNRIRRNHVVLVPDRAGVAVRGAAEAAGGASTSSAQAFLASLKKNRTNPRSAVRETTRIAIPALTSEELESLLKATVEPDGRVIPAAFVPSSESSDGEASAALGLALGLMTAMVVLSGLAGFAAGLLIETIGDQPSGDDKDDTEHGGDAGEGGGDGGADTGDTGRAHGRTGRRSVQVTFHADDHAGAVLRVHEAR